MAQEGDVIANKYRLVAVLGEGGMGAVWRAVQLGLERQVAVKLMHGRYAARDDSRARFAREAKVAATLVHPNSVAVLDFGEQDGLLYLVMELLVGESLADRLDRGPLPRADVLAIIRQIVSALSAAHRLRLVHRDIKPANVFLEMPADGGADVRPTAKVVDFGLAFIDGADDGTTSGVGRLTRDDAVAGTPAYMSPEQVQGGNIGSASDMYALGCLFYELLSGNPPFTGSYGAVMTRHAYSPPLRLRDLELPEPVPAPIDDLVQAMLAKSPPRRPTAARVLAQLSDLDATQTSAVTSALTTARTETAVPRPSVELPASDVGFTLMALGPLPLESELSLGATGIAWQHVKADAVKRGDLVWAPDDDVASLRALVERGAVVITAIDATDIAALPALIRAGVGDALARPVRADEFVRRLVLARRAAEVRA